MTAPFQLDALPTLSRSTVDREETLRTEPDRLARRWPDARVVELDRSGRTPVRAAGTSGLRPGGSALATRKALDYGDTIPDEAMFLGQWSDTDYWTMPGDPAEDVERGAARIAGSWGVLEEVPEVGGELWVDLRGFGDLLDDTSAGLFTTAQALANWHRRARFCAVCGGHTARRQFGWASHCEQCGREEYPRTDPAVICLVHDEAGVNGEHVLLARQPIWPVGRYSVLAGFVEAGESLEGCVEREIREEVGAEVRDIRYLGSQPWPFPRSIMLGFTARADRCAPLTPADDEIEEAFWVSRAEVRAAFANSRLREPGAVPTPIAGGAAGLVLPGNSSIARVMLDAWARAEP
ncbi:NADH pyrophosphatase [Amycolatopsis antarctica]|uniref:NAD(+) diphosphatase n=1 Tax=Amycolatopsis antarctica TaxID=1854586 RepID=A0A263DCT3_9PSEU|nr:NAD(+) diphosphatase [Amycolatopsis antarctica]OZM75195.1 NADH pyrophosphatase [Amycolatopsis antarctica]